MIWPLPKQNFPGPAVVNQYAAVARIRVRLILTETHTDGGGGGPTAEFSIDQEWEFSRVYLPDSPAAGEFTLSESHAEPRDWEVASVGEEWVGTGEFVITDGGTDARDLSVTPALQRLPAASPGGAPLPRPTGAAPGSELKLTAALDYSGTPGNWSLTAEPFEWSVAIPDMAAIQSVPLLLTEAGTSSYSYLGIGTISVDREWDIEVEFLGP